MSELPESATVMVTGGAGRLGCALVRALLERNCRVRVLDLSPGDGIPASLQGLDIDFIAGSVLDADAVATAIGDASVVFHLAAKLDLDRDFDGSVHAVNVEGARCVAQACLERKLRLVHCSSHHALVLEPLSETLDESKPLALDHVCPYHRSKAQGEKLVSEMIQQQGLNAVIVNPGALMGPMDYEPSLLGQVFIDMFHGRLPALLNIVADCADIRDVSAAIITAAERGRVGERYLLTGEPVSLRQMTQTWSELTGCKVPRLYLPLWFGWLVVPFTIAAARLSKTKPKLTPNMVRAGVSNVEVSTAKAEAELGYTPRSVEHSLRDAYDFYKQQGWLD